MIIRGFRIENYGVFSDFPVEGLKPGTTVVTGPNEAGKSTLLLFLVHTLFGYPDKRSTKSPQPPATTGTPSGTVTLEDDKGLTYTVARVQGKSAIVHMPDGTRAGDEILPGLLGNFDAGSYRAVFGFDLADLSEFLALDINQVKDRLISAGITGAKETVQKTVAVLEKTMADNLKPRGQAVINKLAAEARDLESRIRQAEKEEASYAGLRERRALHLEECASLAAEMDEISREAERLRTLINLKPAALKFAKAKTELDKLDAPSSFPENALNRYEKAAGELATATAERARLETEIKELTLEIGENEPNLLWVGKAVEIEALSRSAPLWENLQNEAIGIKAGLDLSRETIKAHLDDLGPGWTIGRLIKFDTGLESRARVRRLKDRLDAIDAEASKASADMARQKAKAAELANAAASSPLPKKALALCLTLGAAFLLAAVLTGDTTRMAFILLTGLAFGIALVLASRRTDSGLSSTAELARAEVEGTAATIKDIENRLVGLNAEWRSLLSDLRIEGETPEPALLLDLFDRADAAKRDLTELNRREKNLLEAENKILSMENGARATLAPLIPEAVKKEGRDLIALLGQAFDRARLEKEKAAKREGLQNLVTRAENRLETARSEEGARKEELKALLDLSHATDEEDFRAKEAAWSARAGLGKIMDEAVFTMESHLGRVDLSAPVFEELFTGGIDGWTTALESLKKNLAEKRAAHDEANRAYGAEGAAMNDLLASGLLPSLSADLEAVRSEARTAAAEWRKAALANHLVNAALETYARDRQPAVYAEASRIFSGITGGRYISVLQPPGGTEIAAKRADGLLYRPEELSRGAREELYLSLRLGLAADYSSRGANLPLIADDVFVNFDPARKAGAIKAVTGRAMNGQAIIFTCHPETVEEIKKADPASRIIEINPKGPGESGKPA